MKSICKRNLRRLYQLLALYEEKFGGVTFWCRNVCNFSHAFQCARHCL